jgi:tetratricopeptide (TPR) repeat protein
MSGGAALNAVALALSLALGAPNGGAEAHLVAGAAHFRAARYAEALVEFRVAERLGEREAAAYAGAALVKLERWDEAVETFETAVPGGHPLHDYYRALACYGARLYACADRLLADVGDRSGPRIAEQARELREEIARALSAAPSETSLAWYRARCEARRAEGRAALAAAYCREADALAARRVGATRAAGVDTAAAPRNGGGP